MKNNPLLSNPVYKINLSTSFQRKTLKLTAVFRQNYMFKQPRDCEIREIRENKFSRIHRKFESRK